MQPLLAADPTRVGPYRLAGRLGSGGMGVVYLGISPTADRFAIKVITPALMSDGEFRARFGAEVETLRTVTGTRTARLERADLDNDPPWLATEFVPGRTLQAQVEVGGPLDQRVGAMLGALLVEGLRSVHDVGLVHRDLKPANIMLGPSGPMVIDFGLAVLRDRTSRLTGTGQPVGTLAYMSPEQARSDTLSPSTDVYALGATMVYALTARSVYPQAPPLALLKRIDDPTDPPATAGVPDDLLALVNSMLSYEPETRPTLDAVFNHLVAVATAGGVTAEGVRADLAARTYFDDLVDLPDWTSEPTEDDSEVAEQDSGSSRLGSWPPVPAPEQPRVPSAPAADVTWLVDEMRTRYDRGALLT